VRSAPLFPGSHGGAQLLAWKQSGTSRTLNATVEKVDNLVWLPSARKNENQWRGPLLTRFVRRPVLTVPVCTGIQITRGSILLRINEHISRSILTLVVRVVLRSGTILLRKDTMEALLCMVRTWWSTPSPPIVGTMVRTFVYLCASKP
jgi:hypothetical protein